MKGGNKNTIHTKKIYNLKTRSGKRTIERLTLKGKMEVRGTQEGKETAL